MTLDEDDLNRVQALATEGDDFDKAAYRMLQLDFDAEGFMLTWDEIHARMVRFEKLISEDTSASTEQGNDDSNAIG